MVDQDMQAALVVTSYQGRWVLMSDSVGELGPTLPLEGRLFGRAGPQTVLSYSTCGGDRPHVCLFLFLGEMGPDIRQCGGARHHTVPRKQ